MNRRHAALALTAALTVSTLIAAPASSAPAAVAPVADEMSVIVVRSGTPQAASTYRPKVSKSLYAAHKGLDRDTDGIACER